MDQNINHIQDVLSLTASDMAGVNDHLKNQLNSEVVLINQIAAYIINNGGKRLRPMLLLLIAKALNYSGDQGPQLGGGD